MAHRNQIPIFLVMLCFLAFKATARKNPNPNHAENNTANLHILNKLSSSSSSSPVYISCESKVYSEDGQELGYGKYFELRVTKGIYYSCYAASGSKFRAWNAYQPRRDQNYSDVYWRLIEDGLYHSWDNSTWIRRASWETE